MSAGAFGWAWKQALAPSLKQVLMVVADGAGADGTCRLAIKEIARRVVASQRAVHAALVKLEQGKFIRKDGRNGVATAYFVNVSPKRPMQNVQRSGGQTYAECASPPMQNVQRSASKRATSAESAGVDSRARADEVPQASSTGVPVERVQTGLDSDSPLRARGAQCAKPASQLIPGFDDFWLIYPRKTGKDAARRAWIAACKRASPDVILAGLAQHQFTPEPRYVPHPATWLNGGHWQDEQPPGLYAPRIAPSVHEKSRRDRQHERIMAMVDGDGEARH